MNVITFKNYLLASTKNGNNNEMGVAIITNFADLLQSLDVVWALVQIQASIINSLIIKKIKNETLKN